MNYKQWMNTPKTEPVPSPSWDDGEEEHSSEDNVFIYQINTETTPGITPPTQEEIERAWEIIKQGGK